METNAQTSVAGTVPSSSLPPHHAAFLWGGKFNPSSTDREWWGCKMQPSENPTAASLLSLCLLSSRGHGHCQWLGEAILAKVPRDPDGGEVQFMPYRKITLLPAWDFPAPCCPLGTRRPGQGVGERDIRGLHSPPKFIGTLNPSKLDLFILHESLISERCSLIP